MSTSPSIQQSLCQTYQRTNWQHLLHSLFPDGTVRLFATPQRLAASQEKVKTTLQLGTIDLADGTTIALLEVETTDQVKLARNRVGLRNFVSTFIDEAGASAVLAVFHQEKSDDWRLTYAARQTTLDEETSAIVTIETAPRRFTFVLGKNEPCRTAAARLATILEKGDELTLPVVEKAFSVETLSKDFFKKYKEHYQAFVTHLLAPPRQAGTRKTFGIPALTDADEQEKADKPVRDFVKTLMGRLVFLHFLQKKGWLGCKAGTKAWVGGDSDFLQSLFTMAESRKDAPQFHSKYLSPLFFEALNMPERAGDIFALTNSRLPYLNGGLFEEDSPALRALDVAPELFANLLDFFAEYNFTIDENDPEDHEVGIDPEMLGHIFENQLEDNKEKGAFYTPKPSVSFMARESLRHYLESHLGPDPEIAQLLNEKDLTRLTKGGFVHRHAKDIAVLLEKVQICDPAIGSGAFPIGVLQEILWTRLALNWELNTPTERARLKRQIIQNSIHGVDIDPGAVEIARLRFWLALVVDEDVPRPLPNLDYKIMQGNSLLESFAGIDLSRISSGAQPLMAITEILGTNQGEFLLDEARSQMELRVGQRRDAITTLLRDYYSETDPAAKKQRHIRIDAEVIAHLEHAIAWERERIECLLDQQQKMLAGKIARTRAWTAAKAARQIAAYQTELTALAEKQSQLLGLQASETHPFFLWHLYFQDVFDQGGFDIVIANPPYVRHELIKDQKPLLEAEGYQCFTGTADLFVYFYEQAINLLKPNGVLTFITSNKYYRAGYGEKLRAHLAKELTLQTLIDFRDAPVFNEIIAYASILIGLKKEASAKHEVSTLVWDLTKKAAALPWEIRKAFPVRQNTLTSDGWRLVDPTVNALLVKLRSKGTPLGEYVKGRFYRGILTGYNEAFVIDEKKRAELIVSDPKSKEIIKPFLRGRDVKRWKATHADLYLIFTRRGIDIGSYPAIKKHLSRYRDALEPKPSDWPSNKNWPGRKAGSYKWFEIQDNIAYWEEFKRTKILYQEIATFQAFCWDTSGALSNNKTFLIPTSSHEILPILNSKITWWFLDSIATKMVGGAYAMQSPFVSQFPIPGIPPADKSRLVALAESCAAATAKNDGAAIAALETEINQIVYRLFDLTAKEVRLIESTLNP